MPGSGHVDLHAGRRRGISLFDYRPNGHCVFVLGNESEGVSREVSELADTALSIPMRNGVESLNVAVTASLIAFSGMLEQSL